ncbi:MAG: hypothetical protein R2755_26435 [Acidimicrobiales bacterium]
MTVLVAQISLPNPVDVIPAAVASPGGWAFSQVSDGIERWILGAVGHFVEGAVRFLLEAASPDVQAVWFSGDGSPYTTVRSVAVSLLLAFVFLGIVQGLLAGNGAALLRQIALHLPAAVLGMVASTEVVAKLVALTDALSSAVLAGADGQAVQFLSTFGQAINTSTSGFAGVLLGLVAVIAALFVWLELMVRSVLIYVIVAISPLSFAAMTWPATRGVLRRTVELLSAIIVSKLVICIALRVGVAALAGPTTTLQLEPGSDPTAAATGALLTGGTVLALAAFAPFLVLKLIPWAEASLVAQGVSRSPVRGMHAAAMHATSAQSLSRLAGGGVAASTTGGMAAALPHEGPVAAQVASPAHQSLAGQRGSGGAAPVGSATPAVEASARGGSSRSAPAADPGTPSAAQPAAGISADGAAGPDSARIRARTDAPMSPPRSENGQAHG